MGPRTSETTMIFRSLTNKIIFIILNEAIASCSIWYLWVISYFTGFTVILRHSIFKRYIYIKSIRVQQLRLNNSLVWWTSMCVFLYPWLIHVYICLRFFPIKHACIFLTILFVDFAWKSSSLSLAKIYTLHLLQVVGDCIITVANGKRWGLC